MYILTTDKALPWLSTFLVARDRNLIQHKNGSIGSHHQIVEKTGMELCQEGLEPRMLTSSPIPSHWASVSVLFIHTTLVPIAGNLANHSPGSAPVTQTPPIRPHLQSGVSNINMKFGGEEFPNHSIPPLAPKTDVLLTCKVQSSISMVPNVLSCSSTNSKVQSLKSHLRFKISSFQLSACKIKNKLFNSKIQWLYRHSHVRHSHAKSVKRKGY